MVAINRAFPKNIFQNISVIREEIEQPHPWYSSMLIFWDTIIKMSKPIYRLKVNRSYVLLAFIEYIECPWLNTTQIIL